MAEISDMKMSCLRYNRGLPQAVWHKLSTNVGPSASEDVFSYVNAGLPHAAPKSGSIPASLGCSQLPQGRLQQVGRCRSNSTQQQGERRSDLRKAWYRRRQLHSTAYAGLQE